MVAILISLASCDHRRSTSGYTFVVAGHAYGAHAARGGTNLGLYPKFVAALMRDPAAGSEFMILLGDSVRKSNKQAWQAVAEELSQVGIPYYMVLGNHDSNRAGVRFLAKRYDGTYYSFDRGTERFIVLDVQRDWGRISGEQLEFLRAELGNLDGIRNVFLLLHELIWTQGDDRYHALRHNYGTYNGRFESNYWTEIYPLLKNTPDIDKFVMAGDVGGNPGALPALFEERDGITYIATGMGEVAEENYLLVSVENGTPRFTVIPLDRPDVQWPLERFRYPPPN